jgi:hypothetical protein
MRLERSQPASEGRRGPTRRLGGSQYERGDPASLTSNHPPFIGIALRLCIDFFRQNLDL